LKPHPAPGRLIPLVLASLLLFSGISAAGTGGPLPLGPRADFDQGLAQYRAGRWASAYGTFSRLADGGDAESARLALILLKYGEQLNGSGWGASQPQIKHWMRLASRPMAPVVSQSGD